VLLALGIVGIAAGLVYDWEYLSLLVAVPLLLGAGAAWMSVIQREMQPPRVVPGAEIEPLSAPPMVSGGRVLAPVPPRVLAAQAAGGAAIAIERAEAAPISRRTILRTTFWAGLGAGLAAIGGSVVDFLYPRGITGFGGVVSAGTVSEYAPGTKTENPEGKFWLVNLTEEQGGPGFLALWWKCPHLGCTVPWRETFSFVDPATGQDKRGWFRCPCHGSTYNDAGVRVFGPAPRSMDRMQLTIDPSSGRISVNTGSITKGTPDNNKFAVQP
jgi:cytochrome b6-f complex iron-sulfur subunit